MLRRSSAAVATSREGHLSGFHPVAPHAPECLGAFVIWTDFKMPNTINATNPMPTNSTTSATESYSSQCRLPESMTFHPCFKWTVRIGRQLLTRSLGDLLTSSRPAEQATARESENQALILELLDWKKFYVRQIVYFPNGRCRRRCGFRDGTLRHRLASTRVQPKPIATAASPAVTHMTARLIEVLLPVRNWGREL